MIAPEEAWRRIASVARPLPAERVARRSAGGRVLALPLAATTEAPFADVSAMDGFALDGSVRQGAELVVAGTVAAGAAPGFRLPRGGAARIFTGAPLPLGADRVIPVEEVEEVAGGRIRLGDLPEAGRHVRRRGEITRPGDRLLEAGDRIGPSALALLASQGISEVEVVGAPRLAVVPTGDEVVAPEDEPRPGQLRDSHTDFLLAAAARLGLAAEPLGIAPDDPVELERRIGLGLAGFDVTLVCGGVSAGDRDFTETALGRLGARIEFDAVAIQPGKPLVFAHRDRRLVFGLPGNPASAMVAFRLFVVPALEILRGGSGAFWQDARPVALASALAAGPRRDRFVPARALAAEPGHELVRPLAVRGSHDLATFARADRLLRVRAGEPARGAGDEVEAIDWS